MGASNMSVINDLQTGIYRDNLLPISKLGDANTALIKFARSNYRMVVSNTQDEIDVFKKKAESNVVDMRKYLEEYSSAKMSAKEKDLYAKFNIAFDAYYKAASKVQEMAAKGDKEGAIQYMLTEAAKLSEAPDALLMELIVENQNQAKASNDEGDAIYAASSRTMYIIIGVAAALGMLIGVTLSRMISRGIKQCAEFGLALSRGDLSGNLDIDQKDEVGMLACWPTPCVP